MRGKWVAAEQICIYLFSMIYCKLNEHAKTCNAVFL